MSPNQRTRLNHKTSPNQSRIRTVADNDVSRSALEAGRIARAIGFDTNVRQMITTATSELARNILKYAGRGEVQIAEIRRHNRVGIEIIASDRGPGIADVDRALSDHFSSSGTLGLGLPGVKRMMDELEIESEPGRGTRVVARKWR